LRVLTTVAIAGFMFERIEPHVRWANGPIIRRDWIPHRTLLNDGPRPAPSSGGVADSGFPTREFRQIRDREYARRHFEQKITGRPRPKATDETIGREIHERI